jgi:hypothetical protein
MHSQMRVTHFLRWPGPLESRIIGLIGFFALAVTRRSIIAGTIFFNGILFHAGFPNTRLVRWYDVSCNFVLGWYVFNDQYPKSVFVPTLIALAALGFGINVLRGKRDAYETIIHVIGVQWTCCFALFWSKL